MKCEYGCGKEGKHLLPYVKKWCCSKSQNSCPEVRKKFSVAKQGKILTEEHKRKIGLSGRGKERSKETKKRMTTAKIKWHREIGFTEETKKQISQSRKGKCCGPENHMYRKSGPLSPVWNGGTKLYASDWGPKVKQKVFERDGYVCQNCESKENLVPHHIDYDKMNCDSTNLITVCSRCNLKANGNRDYWQKLYEEKIREK